MRSLGSSRSRSRSGRLVFACLNNAPTNQPAPANHTDDDSDDDEHEHDDDSDDDDEDGALNNQPTGLILTKMRHFEVAENSAMLQISRKGNLCLFFGNVKFLPLCYGHP